MKSSSSSFKAVVIGGGVFGVSSALHLARRGVHTTIVTDRRPADGASGRSLSWLNSSRARSPEYHRLRMIGIDRYRTLAATHPGAAWLRFDGGLTWDADDASNGIAEAFAHERSIGYDAQLLTADEAAAAIPGIDPNAITPQGAIFNPGEGWVDLPSLIEVLLAEFVSLGGKLVLDAGKASVQITSGGVQGVLTAAGETFDADAVLVAVGAAVPEFVAQIGRRIPDSTPIALLVRTKPVNVPLRAVLNTPRVAIRPTPTGSLVLDSDWSEKEVIILPDGAYHIKESTVHGLLTAATQVLAGNPTLALDSIGVGPKPIPKDGEPVFGQLDGLPGYYLAFSHSGATLGLIAGELIADEIATGQPHPLLAPYRPGRFGA